VAGSLLQARTPDERQAFTARAVRRRVPRGTTLFIEGHPVDRVVVILQGRVKVCHRTDDGQELVFTLHEPGDLLGIWRRSPPGRRSRRWLPWSRWRGWLCRPVSSGPSSTSIPGWRWWCWSG
jgi:hypothetical protein